MSSELKQVKQFWNESPLWVGESRYDVGSELFFKEQQEVVVNDCFAGEINDVIFPEVAKAGIVLDLGCGIGFWTNELVQRGYKNVISADLSRNSLRLAKTRSDVFRYSSPLVCGNAEMLPFKTGAFDHVNCMGVIHHTPNPQNAVREIARILRPGGTASISVYFKNFFIRNWKILWPVGKAASRVGFDLRGRGRESIFATRNVDDLVKLYDGQNNPVGFSYSKEELFDLVNPHLRIERLFYHFFPARALPFKFPQRIHRFFNDHLGFMIGACLSKAR